MTKQQASPGTLYVNYCTGDSEIGFVFCADEPGRSAFEMWAGEDLTRVTLSSAGCRSCGLLCEAGE